MNWVMKERNSSNWRHDAFRTRAPIVHSQRDPSAMHRETRGKAFSREWVAHRTWEDDGGSVGRDRRRNAL